MTADLQKVMNNAIWLKIKADLARVAAMETEGNVRSDWCQTAEKSYEEAL